MSETELVSNNSESLSSVCDRDATTIEPLVKGQQFIAADVGEGSVNSFALMSSVGFGARLAVKVLCRALQHAREFIDGDIDIACSVDIDESASPIDARA